MTRRLTVQDTEIRSQTVTTRRDVRARLDLPLDGPPCRNPGGPTEPPAARTVAPHRQGAPASIAETENNE